MEEGQGRGGEEEGEEKKRTPSRIFFTVAPPVAASFANGQG